MSKKKVILVLTLILSSGVVLGQSLQELANKEKARRKKLPPTAKVYTDEDLAEGKKDLPADPDAPPAEVRNAPPAVPSQEDLDREQAKADEAERAAQKDRDWETLFNQYQSRYDAVKVDIGQLRQLQAECEKNLAYMMAYPAMDDCKGYPPQIKAKQGELRQIEDQAADDARRRGVLPGKARLRN